MLSNPQLVAQSGAIVSEEGPITMQFGDSNIIMQMEALLQLFYMKELISLLRVQPEQT